MVSLSFASGYAMAYWGSIGFLLAVLVPIDPTIVGPKSALGPMLHIVPENDLTELHVWLSHAWGVTMLGLVAGYYFSRSSTSSTSTSTSSTSADAVDLWFVRTIAIATIAWYPVSIYAMWYEFGFFWKLFPPVLAWNTFVYVSALVEASKKNKVEKAE
jgi:hypothetical protein